MLHPVILIVSTAVPHPRHRMVRRAAGTGGRIERFLERLVVVESATLPLGVVTRRIERAGFPSLGRWLLARFTRLGAYPPARLAGPGLGRARGPGPPWSLGNRAVEFAADIAGSCTARTGSRRCGAFGGPALAPGPPGGGSGRRCCGCAGFCAGRTSPWGSFGGTTARRGFRGGIVLDGPVPAHRCRGGFAEHQPGKLRCDR